MIYIVHIIILDYNQIVSLCCNVGVISANEKLRFIYLGVKQLEDIYCHWWQIW